MVMFDIGMYYEILKYILQHNKVQVFDDNEWENDDFSKQAASSGLHPESRATLPMNSNEIRKNQKQYKYGWQLSAVGFK